MKVEDETILTVMRPSVAPQRDLDRSEVLDLRGLIPTSLNEWEGRIAAVVFTAGCNWRCPYCHGWRFVGEPQSLEPIPPSRVYALLERQRGWIDGVAVSGGEPTLQPGLEGFLREIKARGAAVKLETNGSRPEVVERLLSEGLLDCLALDYKAPLDGRLEVLAGVAPWIVNLEGVKQTFALSAEAAIEREYHTTLCPAFVDVATIREMAEALPPGGLWILQQYERGDVLDPQRAGSLRYDTKALEEIEHVAKTYYRGQILLRRGQP